VDEQQKQTLLDLPKVIAVGISSPAVTVLTSRFGVGGTLLGLALSSVLITVATDFLKVYLARAPGAVTSIPGGFKKRPHWQQILYRLRQPFSKFASLAPARRRSILRRSVIAGAMAFVVGLVVVTGVEASVGKNLSCWVWNECPTKGSSTTGEEASTTSTLPSILGGGQDVVGRSNTPQEERQQPSSQPSGTPTAKTPPPASSPSAQQQQQVSGAPEGQQQSSPTPVVEQEQQEQQSSSSPTGEQQSSSSSTKVTEDQQQSP
jgi:hypothetical protein